MANTAANIKKNIDLTKFYGMHEKMQMGSFEHTDEETGEVQHFKSLIFSNGDSKTFVGFSPKLGELTPKEIVAQKNNLQVVEWDNPDTGKHGYTLCKKGNGAWEDIIL